MPRSEFELIEWIRARSQGANVPIGIGDDMAAFGTDGGGEILVTADMLLDGVHFVTGRDSYPLIGRKTMACSLSDAAAMAAVPVAAVLSVALNHEIAWEQVQDLWKGVQELAEEFSCPVIGGDTTSWKHPLALNVTLFAEARGISPVLRNGAKAGDAIFVTGSLGGSIRGRHLRFQPRVREARQLAQICPLHAMIDLSDGLAADLNHICDESQLGVVIDADLIPVDAAADSFESALSDGEDFELLFTVADSCVELLQSRWKESTPITRIGTVVEKPGIQLRSRGGTMRPLPPGGYQHVIGN